MRRAKVSLLKKHFALFLPIFRPVKFMGREAGRQACVACRLDFNMYGNSKVNVILGVAAVPQTLSRTPLPST